MLHFLEIPFFMLYKKKKGIRGEDSKLKPTARLCSQAQKLHSDATVSESLELLSHNNLSGKIT